MSLILEALRKSEAQRRLGQAPDLYAAMPPPRRRRRIPRWAVPALVLMLVGAGAWWLGRMAVPDPGNGGGHGAPADADAPAELALPATVPGEAAPSADIRAVTAAARAPAMEADPLPATDAEPSPATIATPAPAPARVDPPPVPAAPGPPPVATAPAPRDLPATPAQPDPAPAAPTSAAPAPGTAGEAGLPGLSDLPGAVRATLPELRISMHVYNDDPARRFAIIDGRRVGEGALVGNSGVVESIRRDGIVVDFDGRRILLPRP